jgi:hypothetical protein
MMTMFGGRDAPALAALDAADEKMSVQHARSSSGSWRMELGEVMLKKREVQNLVRRVQSFSYLFLIIFLSAVLRHVQTDILTKEKEVKRKIREKDLHQTGHQ